MNWLRLFAHFRRLTVQVKRVADGLDRAFPLPSTEPSPPHPRRRPAGLDALSSYDAEGDWLAEQEEERLRELAVDQLVPKEGDHGDA